jgi:hypothetical protein
MRSCDMYRLRARLWAGGRRVDTNHRFLPPSLRPTMDSSRILTTLNPPFAGTRILSLDGLVSNIGNYKIRADNVDRGGMKGIVELLVLKAIESELGSGLQVQHFFDLIVGTRFVISCFGAALCFS